MEDSVRLGFMAVCAVSGSMVFLVHQVHKRLFSNFMEKFEFEMGGVLRAHAPNNLRVSDHKHLTKKKVRFSELPPENKIFRRKVTKAWQGLEDIQKWRGGTRLEDIMPPNRAVLYRGIMKYRTLKGKFSF